MLKVFRRHWFLSGCVMLGLVLFVWVRYRMWGPYRDYVVDVAVWSGAEPVAKEKPLEVGVARRDITPDLAAYDKWMDEDNDNEFQPKKGDRYEDRNRNGTFDLVWLAGFDNRRAAKGVNDPLWTRAIAFRHGAVTVVMVTIDSVGLTHERFIKVRKSIDHAKHGITHILFSSTHTHNAPDTMGIWSYRPIFSKFDEGYLELVLEKTREAVLEAVANLQPVDTVYGMEELEPDGMVRDSRRPEVLDRKLCAARFVRKGTDETVATLVSWGNHPEAFGGDNPLISSDFPHYLREALERGLPEPAGMKGFGGECLYFQGPVGGLMTPLGLTVPDRNGKDVHKENGRGKTQALGENVALRVAKLLTGPGARRMQTNDVLVVARTVFVPIAGTFKYPLMLGLIHPGWYDGKAKTEIDAVRVGEIEVLTVPGELYPEISEGGVEAPEGGDYGGPVAEVPPLRGEMRGGMNMVFNLANDEVGYIIPRSQWDTKPPFTYGQKKAPYGEVNSGGPEAAPVLHREALETLKRLHGLRGL